MAIDLMSMKLPSKKKVEVEMEEAPSSEMGEEMMAEEEMPMEASPLAEFDDAMLLEECKLRGLV